MARIETVKVVKEGSKKGYHIINKSDMTKDHKLYKEPKAPAKPKAPAEDK